jgi:hypothetical protein
VVLIVFPRQAFSTGIIKRFYGIHCYILVQNTRGWEIFFFEHANTIAVNQTTQPRVLEAIIYVVCTIIVFEMENILEVKNITLPHSIIGRLPSEMAQIKPTYVYYQNMKKFSSNSVENWPRIGTRSAKIF